MRHPKFVQKNLSRSNELRLHPAYRHNPFIVWGRIFQWAAHCLLKIPARARLKRWEITLYLPPKWSGSGATGPFLFREYYEPGLLLLERFLTSGMTFVDGGANKGIYTFVAARLVGANGRVLAFEPGKESFSALQKSLEINHFDQVVLRKQALSDRTTLARLYHHRSQEGSFGLGPSDNLRVGYEEVETITLEQAFAEMGIQRFHFLKLDVEGSQELVLRGSIGLLSRRKPLMLIEVDGKACRRLNLNPDGTWHLLCELGYGFFVCNDRAQVYPIANPDGFRNLLAIHKTCPLFKEFHL